MKACFPQSILFSVILWAVAFAGLPDSARAGLVQFTFTGTGQHGSLASGKFSVYEDSLQPNFSSYAACASFALTISNIPGPGPGLVSFTLSEAQGLFAVDSNGVPSIVPLGSHSYGPPEQNNYVLGGGTEPNQSVLVYSAQLSDTITWSGLTLASLPAAPMVSSQNTSSNLTLHWPVSADSFAVEGTTNLAPPVNWSAVTNEVTSAGGMFSVTMPLPLEGTGNHFFRLRWPGP